MMKMTLLCLSLAMLCGELTDRRDLYGSLLTYNFRPATGQPDEDGASVPVPAGGPQQPKICITPNCKLLSCRSNSG